MAKKTLAELQAERARIDAEIAAAGGDLPKPVRVSKSAPAPAAETLDDRDSDFNLAKSNEMVIFQPRHPLIAKPGQREQDLKPQRMFFYKRLDTDQIVCFTEAEAAMQEKGSHRFLLRQVGVSDGSAYWQSIRSCGVKNGQRIPLAQAQKILADAFAAELESARGKYSKPLPQNVHFDSSFPLDQRNGFVPPA